MRNFVDLAQAFYPLNHHILTSKLEQYGITVVANIVIKSYLTDRKQLVKVNDWLSKKSLLALMFPSVLVSFAHCFHCFS